MKKVLFVLIAAVSLTACTKSTDLVAKKNEPTTRYWRVEATETSGNIIYSTVSVTRN